MVDKLFDGKALIKALKDGITELCFVLSAPIIFLGLGFSLHFFSLQKGITKWFKMAAIILVTLFFDCILAYKIGEQIHNIKVIMGLAPLDEVYTINTEEGNKKFLLPTAETALVNLHSNEILNINELPKLL